MAGEAMGEWLDCDTGAAPAPEGWRHLEFIATWTLDPDGPPAPTWFLISAADVATMRGILDGLESTGPVDFQ